MIEFGLDLAQTAFLCGIFYRMGTFATGLEAIKNNVVRLTKRVDEIEREISNEILD